MRVIILGATSGIAEVTARKYAADGAAILLVGRQSGRLEQIAADLRIRGAEKVEVALSDLAAETDVPARFDEFVAALGGVDHVLLAYGILGEQTVAERDFAEAGKIMWSNFNSAAFWSLAVANVLEKQGRGVLVVIGSVAGDRGRRGNFVYGASKAGIAAIVEGIAHRFASKGPRAVLIKPGPTVTPMTAGFNRKGFTWAQPEKVADIIYRKANGSGVIAYAPWFWRYIMLIIRNLPYRIFNRMDI